ncbi:DUF418 domain-containing protein [Alteromonas sp. S015]|uniref:DUF418 domain-containing protein n=1 Tax=Alteromonas sp. S015 TaxID=3117401 RepID=UPI002FE31247
MRIQSIDAIRGLAILGILFLNIAYHQNFHTGYVFFEEALLSDEIISIISTLFLDGRFRTLFCLLFGAGLAIQFDACQKRGHNFLVFSQSRLKWLFLFGLIHGVFIFGGDILLYYSLCAFFVLKHLTLSQEELRAKSVKYLVVGSIIMLVSGIVITFSYDYGGALPLRASEAYAEEVVAWQKSYLFQIGVQASFVLATIIAAPFTMLWQSMGLMMFGAYLYRSGFFSVGFSSTIFKRVAIIAVVASIITVIPQLMFEQVTSDVIPIFASIPAIFCAFVFAHLLIKLKNTRTWWYQSLINCGKVAFTLYLTQSIVLAVLFRVITPVYYPEFAYTVTLLDLVLISLVLTVMQILLANFITKHFEQGPFEAAWRTLYLRSFQKKQQNKQVDTWVSEQ